MNYPKFADVCGTRYPLKTSFRVGLRCFRVINDPNISDEERALAVIYLLFGFVPSENLEVFLEKADLFLSCGKKNGGSGTGRAPDMDFEADSAYISASFMSDYKIDLRNVDLHWWQFCELIGGLTETAVLSRVREIRNYDLTQIKDEKTKQKIMAAKQAFALPVRHSAEEQQAIDEFEALFEQKGG